MGHADDIHPLVSIGRTRPPLLHSSWRARQAVVVTTSAGWSKPHAATIKRASTFDIGRLPYLQRRGSAFSVGTHQRRDYPIKGGRRRRGRPAPRVGPSAPASPGRCRPPRLRWRLRGGPLWRVATCRTSRELAVATSPVAGSTGTAAPGRGRDRDPGGAKLRPAGRVPGRASARPGASTPFPASNPSGIAGSRKGRCNSQTGGPIQTANFRRPGGMTLALGIDVLGHESVG
jgi:hypothetical protein